jgi:predicted RNA-binding Zn-ribbon protein involved in translation (DUF1610 family)
MVTKKSKDWIEAAKKLINESCDKIPCPNCGHEFLEITKQPWPNHDKQDIYFYCEKCGSKNVMTTSMLRKG